MKKSQKKQVCLVFPIVLYLSPSTTKCIVLHLATLNHFHHATEEIHKNNTPSPTWFER
jgi:hypothetical protein